MNGVVLFFPFSIVFPTKIATTKTTEMSDEIGPPLKAAEQLGPW